MAPGVFITCPDIMEPFSLKDSDWDFEKTPGITAIAHPSPIEIGTTHGVFILAEKPHVNCANHSELPSVTQSTCIQFLHKPSKERMHDANAVFLIANDEYVYTDGEFYMDWATTAKLVKLYQKLSPLGCEIDAFGDFLQALGENSNKEYCKNVANVVQVVPKLVETREKFYDELQGTQFNVLLFNKSKFYHIGTMTEYIEAFCDNLVM
ncbi:Fucose-1-phosphate guanylyltransferase, partial [Paramuricea clavata]